MSFDKLANRVKEAAGQGNLLERKAFGYHETLLQVPAEKKQGSEGQSRGPSHNNRGTIGKMVNTLKNY